MAMDIILVPIDFSDVTARVVATAKEFALAFGSKVVLLHVADPEPEFVGFKPGPIEVRTDVAADLRRERQELEKIKVEFGGGTLNVTALNVQGPAAEKIVHESRALNVSLIVMGSHGHGALHHLLAGSVTTGVLKAAACPVVVVPSGKAS